MPESIEIICKLVDGRVFSAAGGLSSDSQLMPNDPSPWKSYALQDAMPLQDARVSDLTLVDSLLHLEAWIASPALVAFAPMKVAEELAQKSQAIDQRPANKIVIGVENLHQAFQTAIAALRGERSTKFSWTGIHPTAVIHPSAKVASSANIGPYVTVAAGCEIGERTCIHSGVQIAGHCIIGEDCEIFSNAVLYQGTILHSRVMLHASSVLGAYGFGYRQCDNVHVRTAQLGWVEVESDVEIGAGTTIDRGTYGPTRIGRGTKLDNQIQIGHNVHIGEHNLLCAQVGIAGSSSTGNYVVLGGQVGVRDHLRLGDRTMAAAQAGIAMDVPAGESVLGSPALPQREATQMWIHSRRLPEIRKQIKTLESQMKTLMQQMESMANFEPTAPAAGNSEPTALAAGCAKEDATKSSISMATAATAVGSAEKQSFIGNPSHGKSISEAIVNGSGFDKRAAA
jgi:UDP-3-O-[3-hydroxymyristoyl] glucosamine N-acyltransferase